MPKQVRHNRDDIRDMAGRGMTDGQIAKAMGTTSEIIGKIRRKARIDPAWPAKVWTSREIATAKEMAMTGATVVSIAKKLGKPATNVQKRLVAIGYGGLSDYNKSVLPHVVIAWRMRAIGCSVADIAIAIERTRETVRRYIRSKPKWWNDEDGTHKQWGRK